MRLQVWPNQVASSKRSVSPVSLPVASMQQRSRPMGLAHWSSSFDISFGCSCICHQFDPSTGAQAFRDFFAGADGAVRRSIGADTVISCADLVRVVPDVWFDTSLGGNDMIAILGRSMLVASLPARLLVEDDAYVAAPFLVLGVAGTVVAEVLLQLNRDGLQTRHPRAPDGMVS
eukprot:4856471-Amphidinium_carterae.2